MQREDIAGLWGFMLEAFLGLQGVTVARECCMHFQTWESKRPWKFMTEIEHCPWGGMWP